jgi:hypothetical protein
MALTIIYRFLIRSIHLRLLDSPLYSVDLQGTANFVRRKNESKSY